MFQLVLSLVAPAYRIEYELKKQVGHSNAANSDDKLKGVEDDLLVTGDHKNPFSFGSAKQEIKKIWQNFKEPEKPKELSAKEIFSYRETPDWPSRFKQDMVWPKVISYDNYLVGLLDVCDDARYDWLMSNGDKTSYQIPDKTVEKRVPEGATIKKIIMWYQQKNYDRLLRGFQLLGENDEVLVQTGRSWTAFGSKEQVTVLAADERVVQIKANKSQSY